MYLKDNNSIIETRKTIRKRSKIKQAFTYILALLGGQFLGGMFIGLVFADMVSFSGNLTEVNLTVGNLMEKYSDKFMVFSLFGTTIATLVMYMFARIYQKRNKASLGLTGENRVRNYLIGALVGSAMLALVVIINVLIGHMSLSNNIGNVSFGVFALFIIGWVLQGFSEEFMCRAVLMNWLAAEKGVIFGIVVNALLFSLLHFGNSGFALLPAINLFLVGLLYSLMFYISDDIFLVGAAHSFWNFVQGNVFGVQVSGNSYLENTIWKSQMNGQTIMNGGAFGIEGGLVCTVINLVAIIICIKIIWDRKLLVKNK
ncbi:MAG: CPBP family intramembrane glutamic endopeptidase [Finegoldia sp.]|nr:CPBP family intramembrane glutamic endopeptidase [Finegoldia sp.]